MIKNAADPHHVAAGLLRRRGRALLVHRSPGRQWYPDVWDLPGGHAHETESAADEAAGLALVHTHFLELLRAALGPR